MSKRTIELLLADISEAMEKIRRYSAGMTIDSFQSDEKTADAVVRNLEIIGEAANRLPKEFHDKHSQIEWAKIVGLRHRIVHEYFGVDLVLIWQILQNDFPALQKSLEKIH
ncbi:MAG: DUF86 domain-containing protein [Proteobacteria bacterium]|nr:DUF86 domain-containing protein [Pseudomonadota bacterium]MBU1717262.1 DUF86 domain-containing protein [Pseudomonadota bacterium]